MCCTKQLIRSGTILRNTCFNHVLNQGLDQQELNHGVLNYLNQDTINIDLIFDFVVVILSAFLGSGELLRNYDMTQTMSFFQS